MSSNTKVENKAPFRGRLVIRPPKHMHHPEPSDMIGDLPAHGDPAPQTQKPLTKPQKDPAPPRSTRLTNVHYWKLARRVWNIALLTWPLDLAVLWLLNLQPETLVIAPALFQALVVVLLIAGAAFVREDLLSLVLYLSEARERLTSLAQRYAPWVAAVIGLIIFLEVIVRVGGISVQSLLIALVVTLGALQSIWQAIKRGRDHSRELEDDETLRLEHANLRLFVYAVAPIVAARISSLLGLILAIAHGQGIPILLLWMLSGLFLLLLTEPTREHFTFQCRRCGQATSRVLIRSGFCRACQMLSSNTTVSIPDLQRPFSRVATPAPGQPTPASMGRKPPVIERLQKTISGWTGSAR